MKPGVMNMSKHTPGPWAFTQPCCHAITVGNKVIASAEPESQEDIEQSAIDFKLIAAAPELLDALQSFLRAPSTGSNGPGSITIVVQTFNMRAARAAIAKATGGAE